MVGQVRERRSAPIATAIGGVVYGLLALLAPVVAGAQNAQTLAQINQALQAGEADRALGLVHSLPQDGAGIAEAQNIECRIRMTLQQWDTAVQRCEQAVRLDGQNSNNHLWLGRVLGEKAGRASFMSAFSLAKRTRSEFETAVRLNPRNADALADLGDFYQQAPGVVGGGADKAEGVAAQLDKVDPARAHQLRAHLAEARKDYTAAEREFKQSIAAAAHPADNWSTLASFYRRRQQWPQMDSAIRSCIGSAQRDKSAAVALYDGAGVLIEANRDPELAAKMLTDYLASSSKTEEAPAFEAHVRLARLKKQLGDSAGAQREKAAALALAHDYKPALDLRP